MAKFANLRDDFLGATVDTSSNKVASAQGWTYGGTSVDPPTTLTQSTGVGWLRLSTSASANAWLSLGDSAASSVVRYVDLLSLRFSVKLNSTTACTVRLGIGSAPNSTTFGSHSVYLEYDSAADTTWHVYERDTTSTNTDTGVTATTGTITWELVRVSTAVWHLYRSSAGTRSFVVALTSADLPPDANQATLGVRIEDTGGAGKSVDIDLVEFTSVEQDR